MLRFLLPTLCIACLAPTAQADKFYLGSKEAAEKITDGAPDVIEGVLVSEDEEFYVVRIEGGEIQLAKGSVWKVEKDGATTADIEEQERAATERLVAANEQRRQVLAAEASAFEESVRNARTAEASARIDARDAAIEAANATARVETYVFDPIIGVAGGNGRAFESQYLFQKDLAGIQRRAIQRIATGRRPTRRQQ